MCLVCDVIVIISQVFSYNPEVLILVVYLQVFLLFRKVISKINKHSDLYTVMNVLIGQTGMYIQGLALIFFLSMVYVLSLLFLTHLLPSTETLVSLWTRFLSWLFSNEWLDHTSDFLNSMTGVSGTAYVCLTIWVYLGQVLYKNICFRYFFSVVIQGYSSARSVSDLLFNEEIRETLMAAWLDFDPESKGFIEARYFFDFVVSLKPPLFPSKEDLNKIFIHLDKELNKRYPPPYPDPPSQGIAIHNQGGNYRNSMNLNSRIPYYKSASGSHAFTATQYFLLGRMMNIPVYNYGKKK